MAEPLKMIYEQDAPLDALKGKTVAILGFGSQGHAHGLNLRDSGIKVIVANRKDSANGKLAIEHGFDPVSVEDATKAADLIIITLPDEVQPEVWNKSIAPNLKPGTAVGVTHGFNFHFKTITAPKENDVLLIAPKGPGHLVRSEFEKGGGVPCLIAIHQDPSGKAKSIGLAWARGIGGARSGIIETSFKIECETDLFGEQAVLCGGLSSLIKAGRLGLHAIQHQQHRRIRRPDPRPARGRRQGQSRDEKNPHRNSNRPVCQGVASRIRRRHEEFQEDVRSGQRPSGGSHRSKAAGDDAVAEGENPAEVDVRKPPMPPAGVM
jgi:hypothetical protein